MPKTPSNNDLTSPLNFQITVSTTGVTDETLANVDLPKRDETRSKLSNATEAVMSIRSTFGGRNRVLLMHEDTLREMHRIFHAQGEEPYRPVGFGSETAEAIIAKLVDDFLCDHESRSTRELAAELDCTHGAILNNLSRIGYDSPNKILNPAGYELVRVKRGEVALRKIAN